MQTLTITPEQRAHAGPMLMTLFSHWNLTSAESLALLGLSTSNRRALTDYRRGKPLANDRDKLERAGNLLGIHKALRLLFPHNRELAYAWMKTPSRAFNGHTPTQYIEDNGLLGVHAVRAYLDRQRGR